ncbi:MAG: dGTP triphosphohydrolase [Bacteroidota bacterium]
MSKPLYQDGDFERILSPEPFYGGLDPEPYREQWRRDYARLIHSPSFRRLQGKTQLFPGVESDFFRNRLTHSLEVAQIAKSISIRLNYNYTATGEERKKGKSPHKELGISTDLVDFAGLAHDLGHPPFGHQGEEALDECMVNDGGFEGNAQTIRIISRIEKKFRTENFGFENGVDKRVGLNLCYRTLASVLKYDNLIPERKKERIKLAQKEGKVKPSPIKGYYKCDSELIQLIKKKILSGRVVKEGEFKTLECYIMDIADDIAYSTYDLEDGFKAGFISPLDLLYPSNELLADVCNKVNKNLVKENIKKTLTEDTIVDLIRNNILDFGESDSTIHFSEQIKGKYFLDFANSNVDHQYRAAQFIAKNGSIRTGFTSSIVGRFIRGVKLEYNKKEPALSKAKLDDDIRILVEILKTFTFMSQITSPRLKIAEYRGKEIVEKIFTTLNTGNGYELLPSDVQDVYLKAKKSYKSRIICDFVASMTDKYAIEFYGRLTSENPETIFKPF